MLTLGLRDERRSRIVVSTGGDSGEYLRAAERLKGDSQYLTRAMPAEGNRLAGLYTR